MEYVATRDPLRATQARLALAAFRIFFRRNLGHLTQAKTVSYYALVSLLQAVASQADTPVPVPSCGVPEGQNDDRKVPHSRLHT